MSKNDYTSYIAHYRTKGSKNGVRRYQSYLVNPTASGNTGQELGEAAEQRTRVLTKEQEHRVRSLYGEKGLQRVNQALDAGESYQGALHKEATKRQHKEAVKSSVKRHAKIVAAATTAGIASVGMLDIMTNAQANGKNYAKAFNDSYANIKRNPKEFLAKVGLATAGMTVVGEINAARKKIYGY